MELIEINTTNELPKGVEMVLYEPPYMSAEPIQEVTNKFKAKYGSEPQTIYQLGKKLFVVKESNGKR